MAMLSFRVRLFAGIIGLSQVALPETPASIQSVLAKRCIACHNSSLQSGGLNLQALGASAKNPERWERVLERVKNGQMPPKSTGEMPEGERKQINSYLIAELEKLDRAAASPGRVTVRRLNRTEYNNTVRDLLGVDFRPAADFPPDDSGYGFDNIGEVLSMSPALTDKYVRAAEKVARTAIFGSPPVKPSLISIQPWYIDFATSREVKTDYDETGMSLPSALHATHHFPVDGEYEIAGLLRGTRPNGSEHIPVAFWIDGKKVQTLHYPVPPGGEVSGQRRQFRIRVTAGEHWLAASILKTYEGLPPAYAGPNPSKKPLPPPFRRGGVVQQPPNNDEAPAAAPVRQGGLPRQATTAFFVSNVDITGPFNQVEGPAERSLREIYVCGHLHGGHTPSCERKILSTLANRAYRRPVTTQEVDLLASFVRLARDSGDSFEEGLALAIQKALISPSFLFRVEREPRQASGAVYSLNGFELANRLSYFLWSTMPDDDLLAAAARGELSQPAGLRAQARRMLKDPKTSALVENFGGQWLQFRALESHEPDRKKFQEFTEYTRMSLKKETELFVANLVAEDRSILDLIDARYSFLNERLAEYYGIDGVKGHEFRRVDLAAAPRAGVFTQGSVLTVSSYANRTSPVLRGKWILENLLNAAPPPPPADVPNLDEAAVGSSGTLRQQMEKHRENAACASCHAQMDPLGFGLENFDAIGRWRSTDGKFPVDASGQLPDGRKFEGPVELASVLRQDAPAFAEAVTDKLMTYALGRGLTRGDRLAVRQIAQRLPAADYRFSKLVEEIISSQAFRMARRQQP